MMDTPQKTFMVTFTETTGYRIKVQATGAEAAVEAAQDLFERVGPEPSEGFDIDPAIEGGTDDWMAVPLDAPPLPRIGHEPGHPDEWICLCGNVASKAGFSPS